MKSTPTSLTCIIILVASTQVLCETVLDMMTGAFDDQYLGCEKEMEEAARVLLQKEKSDPEFKRLWEIAEERWKNTKPSHMPPEFKDEYGIAVVLYTMESEIYRLLNKNIRISGQSKEYYMENFNYKALHFYLTRALQILGRTCKNQSHTYRGTRISFTVSKYIRFGQFTSSSKNIQVAKGFGEGTLFTINTCYGLDIANISVFKGEEEVLIPAYEKFQLVTQNGNSVTLQSTGQRCSYFNCAYLGGKKKRSLICNGHEGAPPDSGSGDSFSGHNSNF